MIHKYEGENFLNFKNNLLHYFNSKNTELDQNEDLNAVVKIFKEILKDSNIENLNTLDKLELSFHDWDEMHTAIRDNLLGNSNRILYSFSPSHSNDLNPKDLELDEVIESFFIVIYADLYEGSLLRKDSYNIDINKRFIDSLNKYTGLLSPTNFEKLKSLWFIIPRKVFDKFSRSIYNSDFVKQVDELRTNVNFVNEKILISNNLKKDIEVIANSLKEQKNEYNFIGLSKGFTTLRDSKLKELKSEKNGYNFLIFSIFFIIAAKIVWMFYYMLTQNYDQTVLIIVSISTVFLLFIILYFFRISLGNIKSLKSQILQIDLRLTLCQFIHNYNKDTARLRDKSMKESFDKFESVIFAPIMSTDEKMPSTFDGLDQITKIVS